MENPRHVHWTLAAIFGGVVLLSIASAIMSRAIWPLGVPVMLLAGVALAGLLQAVSIAVVLLPIAAVARLIGWCRGKARASNDPGR